jgi:hypothetical protein
VYTGLVINHFRPTSIFRYIFLKNLSAIKLKITNIYKLDFLNQDLSIAERFPKKPGDSETDNFSTHVKDPVVIIKSKTLKAHIKPILSIKFIIVYGDYEMRPLQEKYPFSKSIFRYFRM